MHAKTNIKKKFYYFTRHSVEENSNIPDLIFSSSTLTTTFDVGSVISSVKLLLLLLLLLLLFLLLLLLALQLQ
jgi:hypothetical protein